MELRESIHHAQRHTAKAQNPGLNSVLAASEIQTASDTTLFPFVVGLSCHCP